jgi:hypothetical protein
MCTATTLRYQEPFGGEVMILLFEGRVADLVTPEHRAELDALEQGLARAGGYHTVVSPATALEYAADQVELASVLQPQAFERERRRAADEARARAAADGDDLRTQERAAAQASRELQNAFQTRVASDAARLATAGEHSLTTPASWTSCSSTSTEGSARRCGARSPMAATP